MASDVNWCVYYYIDTCAYCERILPEIVDYFTTRDIPLVIRKPTIVERPSIQGYPALRTNGDPPLLLVGTHILDTLKDTPELLHGRADHRLSEPATGDGDSAL
jgi:hypothetical protein